LYLKEFEQLIKSNHKLNSILFFGESKFYIDYYSKLISNRYDSDLILKMYFEEYDYEQAYNHLAQSSLFGGDNVLIIKSDKVINTNEIKKLISVTNSKDNSFFIYQYLGSNHQKLSKNFNSKDNSVVNIRFFNPYFSDAISILNSRAKSLNMRVDSYTIKYLYNFFAQDLGLAYNELNKLSTLEEELNSNVIDRLSYNLSTISAQAIFEDIITNKNVITDIVKLLEEGEDEIFFITSFSAFIKELFLFFAYIKLHGNINSKNILGYTLPKQIEQKRANLAIKTLKLKHYKLILNQLQADELILKSHSKIDKESFLISSIIKVQSLLLQ